MTASDREIQSGQAVHSQNKNPSNSIRCVRQKVKEIGGFQTAVMTC